MTENQCLSCRRCMPCPAGVDIPQNMKIWENRANMWDGMREQQRAGYCHGCGRCERLCPQFIPIRLRLQALCARSSE